MSKIIATYNLNTNSWVVEDDASTSHCDLEFKFINNSGVVDFQNLTVGYELYQSNINVKVQAGEYINIEDDQSVALTLGNNIDYRLDVMSNNNGIQKTISHTFTTSWEEQSI